MFNLLLAKTEDVERMRDVSIFPSSEFIVHCTRDWLNSDFSRRVITEIDKHDVLSVRDVKYSLQHDYDINPSNLSMGAKNIIVTKFMTYATRLIRMGRNCHKFLAEIASEKDVTAIMENFIALDEDAFSGIQCRCLNDGCFYSIHDLKLRVHDLIGDGVLDD